MRAGKRVFKIRTRTHAIVLFFLLYLCGNFMSFSPVLCTLGVFIHQHLDVFRTTFIGCQLYS